MTTSERLDQALREWVKVFMRRSMYEFMQSLKDTGLTMPQLRTLIRLHHHGSCHVSAIGDELGITAPAASQMVDRLVKMGLLERTEDPEDRRVKRVSISEDGRTWVRKGIEARMEWMKDLANNLSQEQQEQILTALRTITDVALELEGDVQEEMIDLHGMRV